MTRGEINGPDDEQMAAFRFQYQWLINRVFLLPEKTQAGIHRIFIVAHPPVPGNFLQGG